VGFPTEFPQDTNLTQCEELIVCSRTSSEFTFCKEAFTS
jgi:hypothetical protein